MWKYAKKKLGRKEDESVEDKESDGVETEEEFYARMKLENEVREAERQKLALEGQRKRDEERLKREEKRKIEEEARRKQKEMVNNEREERARKRKEDLDTLLRTQKEESLRLLEEHRREADFSILRSREEMELAENQRKVDEEKRELEKIEREREMLRRNEEVRHNMQHLRNINQAASSMLTTVISEAAANSAAETTKMIQNLAVDNEAQQQLNRRIYQHQKELEKATTDEKNKTSQFVRGVDESFHAAATMSEKERDRHEAECRIREKERADSRMLYETERNSMRNKADDELREKNRLHKDATEQVRREKERDAARHDQEMERMRRENSARVEQLLIEERMRMDEMNRMRQEKEEERKMHWSRMRNAFAELMRNRYSGMINKEMETKWDDRFNELRRSYDPVKDAFLELDCIQFRQSDLQSSLIQFEAHLDLLQMSLRTLDEIMSSEFDQVETWKQHQPEARFLDDFGAALRSIRSCIYRTQREIEMTVDAVAMNRDMEDALERVFELTYLEDRMKELSEAVDSIPSVYELKMKYASIA